MAKKNSPASKFEKLQKQAENELIRLRKHIGKQKDVSAFDYAILHEEDLTKAKEAEKYLQELLERFSDEQAKLVLIWDQDGLMHLCRSGLNPITLELHPDGSWTLTASYSITWNDEQLFSFPTKVGEKAHFNRHRPLHRLEKGWFIAIGEKEVADKLLPTKDGRGDRFDFFYRLTKTLGHRLELKEHVKRIKREREETEASCRRHLTELKGLLDEIFFRGPRTEIATKGREADILLQRAQRLADEMRQSKLRCELYGVDTEASREMIAFGDMWITSFKL